jgi:hypothetical protein
MDHLANAEVATWTLERTGWSLVAAHVETLGLWNLDRAELFKRNHLFQTSYVR